MTINKSEDIVTHFVLMDGGIEMKILFCNIANMKYYKGKVDGIDEPQFGGDYVLQTGDAEGKYNFKPIEVDG